MFRATVAGLVLLSSAARAEEGMWPLNQFPAREVQAKYGFSPPQEWVDHLRLGAVRLAGGCSGSLVSPEGLILTNHHCVHSCIEQLSTAKRDYVAQGFYAKSRAAEVRCPEVEINQLVEIRGVTERLARATEGRSGAAYNDALKAEMSRIEKECADSEQVRCDVVTLYHGGRYDLYKYRRYQDVRLVFAPELAIAFFGGDPDNFNFPRYDLDAAFLRVYEQGRPLDTSAEYFRWSKEGAAAGELVFVTGHPGGTSRLRTVAELKYERDIVLPRRLLRLAELRGLLTEFQNRGAEQKRISNGLLFAVENGLKALRGRHEALVDGRVLEQRRKAEADLRSAVQSDRTRLASFGDAWDEIARATGELQKVEKELTYLERGAGFTSDLFNIARQLVRAADELPRPNEERLREYVDSRLPALKQGLFSEAPIYPELEIATLTFSLAKLRETLGADHPAVKRALGKKSPRTLAEELVKGTGLTRVAQRKALFEGGRKAVDASKDPMIAFARRVDADARAVRKLHEDEIESVIKQNREKLAKAQFEIHGTDLYPDATFTLRVSYGTVKGYLEDGREIPPFTTLAGAFERHTGEDPYALPPSWLRAREKLDGSVPFNLVTTNDIIGGNSGSPVLNREAEVVGLIFDGNIHSLGGEYGFDPLTNRAIAVHSRAILHALERVYGAGELVRELTEPRSPPADAPKK